MRVLIAEYYLPEKMPSNYVRPSGELYVDLFMESNGPDSTRIEDRPDAMDAASLIRYIDSKREAISARGPDTEPFGMRDQFAMSALNIAFKESRKHSRMNPANPGGWWEYIAEDAYAMADAMLGARGKK